MLSKSHVCLERVSERTCPGPRSCSSCCCFPSLRYYGASFEVLRDYDILGRYIRCNLFVVQLDVTAMVTRSCYSRVTAGGRALGCLSLMSPDAPRLPDKESAARCHVAGIFLLGSDEVNTTT
jgi:hypothetical protein